MPGCRGKLRSKRPRLDLPGAITASTGLFAFVYGFSHVETSSWGNRYTVASLVASAVLLTLFVATERRVSPPLLPLHIVVDCNRAGAYIAVFTGVIATFGMFLFLTYYMQDTLHYSPVLTGLAYLPMIVVLVTPSDRLVGPGARLRLAHRQRCGGGLRQCPGRPP
jgi:hypothetical protein